MKYNSTAQKPSFALRAGVYSAEIVSAIDKVSSKGNSMVVVELTVLDPETGRTRKLTDYIVVGGEHPQDWKLGHLCEAVGLPKDGDFNPDEVIGRSCDVKVKIKPAKDGYDESNAIADYIRNKTEEGADLATNTASTEPVKAPAKAIDPNEPPF